MRGVVFNLFAKTEDVVVDGPGVGYFFKSPDIRQELVTGNDLTLVFQKILEQLKFAGVGIELLSFPEQLVAGKIDTDIAEQHFAWRFHVSPIVRQRGVHEEFEDIDFAVSHR